MFGKNRIAALQAELDALKEQLKLEKEFSEGRELLLKLIGVDIQNWRQEHRLRAFRTRWIT